MWNHHLQGVQHPSHWKKLYCSQLVGPLWQRKACLLHQISPPCLWKQSGASVANVRSCRLSTLDCNEVHSLLPCRNNVQVLYYVLCCTMSWPIEKAFNSMLCIFLVPLLWVLGAFHLICVWDLYVELLLQLLVQNASDFISQLRKETHCGKVQLVLYYICNRGETISNVVSVTYYDFCCYSGILKVLLKF